MNNTDWSSLIYEDKKKQLFLQQKETLNLFLERGAISQAQHDKSLHDLMEKMELTSSPKESAPLAPSFDPEP